MTIIKTLLWFLSIAKYYILWFIRNSQRSYSDSVRCLVGKTAIVTGGSAGIGYETSVLLASRGCRVIIACRRDSSAIRDEIIKKTGNPHIFTKYLDLAKLSTVRKFAEDIRQSETKIDILVNNAGVGITSDNGTEDGLNTVMQVNYFGHFLLTHLLINQLKASGSANVVFISSLSALLHNLKYMNYGDCSRKTKKYLVNYANSKFLNIFAAQEFGKRLFEHGIQVNCADPGVSETKIFEVSYKAMEGSRWSQDRILLEIASFLHAKDVFEAAQTVFHLASSRDLQSGGHYFGCKPFIKPRILDDRTFCDKVWKKSEELVKMLNEEKMSQIRN